jgi:hypothetical protein
MARLTEFHRQHPDAMGHGGRSLPPGGSVAPGNAAGHDGMYGPTAVRCGGRIFF